MTRFAPLRAGHWSSCFVRYMLAPLILSYVVDDGAQTAYDGRLTMLSGLFLWYRYRRCKRELGHSVTASLMVVLAVDRTAFAALPTCCTWGPVFHTDA